MTKKPNKTTFDDVFRTIALKMPWFMVSLINEVFGENYPDNVKVVQLRNEFVSDAGKVVTDSIFYIGGKYYHIECQSNPDSTMEIRMIEYDFAIAHEYAKRENGEYVIKFPESAVLYLRHNKNTPDKLRVRVEMPNGESIDYNTKIIKAQEYTRDEIFKRKLMVLVPFYLMRFENQFDEMDKDGDKRAEFLKECERLRKSVEQAVGKEDALYNDMINLILKVSDHILTGHPKTKKEVKSVMGGKVLELSSEKLIKKGIKQGRVAGIAEGRVAGIAEGRVAGIAEGLAEGGNTMLYKLVENGSLSVEVAAQNAGNMDVAQFIKNMTAAGYKLP